VSTNGHVRLRTPNRQLVGVGLNLETVSAGPVEDRGIEGSKDAAGGRNGCTVLVQLFLSPRRTQAGFPSVGTSTSPSALYAEAGLQGPRFGIHLRWTCRSNSVTIYSVKSWLDPTGWGIASPAAQAQRGGTAPSGHSTRCSSPLAVGAGRRQRQPDARGFIWLPLASNVPVAAGVCQPWWAMCPDRPRLSRGWVLMSRSRIPCCQPTMTGRLF
jgi:hypothetical protein